MSCVWTVNIDMHVGVISDADVRGGHRRQAVAEPGPRNGDRPAHTVTEPVLVQLLDALADASAPAARDEEYRKGYSRGIRFARICVLDEIAAKSGSFGRVSRTAESWRGREEARTRAALRRIAARLSGEFASGSDGQAAGYRDATAVVGRALSDCAGAMGAAGETPANR